MTLSHVKSIVSLNLVKSVVKLSHVKSFVKLVLADIVTAPFGFLFFLAFFFLLAQSL